MQGNKKILKMVGQRYKLITSTDTDDQRILESDWTRSKRTGHAQSGLLVLNATFSWWLSPCQ